MTEVICDNKRLVYSNAVLSAVFVILTGVFGVLTIVWGGKWIYTLVKLNESSFINDLKGNSTCRDSKKDS